ncbi:conserved hypothetical protein [Sinorhizobium medicae]|uniref:Uncharacterized protein n=1 Tax=Sinorhizobium medicae TaxID=110321 RepID=A0A508X9F8_9HYPH|nr:conserved hypothetical protein [Sinorhizobium medicae]
MAPEKGQVLRRRWKGRRTGAEETSAIFDYLLKLLLRAVFARAARTVVAVATVRTRTTIVTRATAFAARTVVAVALLHHRGRAFLVLVDGDRHVAQDVFVDAHLTLDFVDGRCRRIDVHENVVGLAVLLDAIGEGLQAPVLDAANFAAVRFDHTLVLLDETVDLLRRDILPSEEYVFIKSHCGLPFLRYQPGPRRLSLNDCS